MLPTASLKYSTEHTPTILRYHNSTAKLRGISGPPGCVTGSTVIHYHRGKRNSSRPVTIRDFARKFNSQKYNLPAGSRTWSAELDTCVHSIDEATGVVYYNKVHSAQFTGIKQCYRIVTDTAGVVEITAEDALMNPDRTYCSVADLVVGQTILVKGSMKPIHTRTAKIVAIKDIGEQETFDLTMVAPNHNFVVNDGIIKHNSGKSVGCLKASDHFFARLPNGDCKWVRMDEYREGMEVLQSDTSGATSFAKPIQQVVLPATQWIEVKRRNGQHLLTMCPDHRLPLMQANPKAKTHGEVCTKHASEWFGTGSVVGVHRVLDKIKLPEMVGLDYSDAVLRVLVMAQADGHYPSHLSNKCELGFVKERKIVRCKELLDAANIPYTIRYKAYKSDPKRRVTIVTAHLPDKVKSFPATWYNATQSQCSIIANEALEWDGHKGADWFYSTTDIASAEFIHHCICMAGGRSRVGEDRFRVSDKCKLAYRVSWIQEDSAKRSFNLRNGSVIATRVDALVGEKRYCFTMPTGYFVHKQHDNVMVTGNCAVEHLHFLAQRQQADKNGLRRTRTAFIRSTYSKLQRTTLKTAKEWIMPGSGRITDSAPMSGVLTYPHPSGDGTMVEVNILFLAIESAADLEQMDSLELSSVYINEVNEQLAGIIPSALERVGRYPPPKDGVKCTEPCVSVDFNLPGKEHWLHKLFVEKVFNFNEHFGPDDVEYFEQPAPVICDNYDQILMGALTPDEAEFSFNPKAENLAHLPDGYYGIQLSANSWTRIQSRLMMMWVTPNRGKRIHEDYSPKYHYTNHQIPVEQGMLVLVGFDTSGQHKGLTYAQYINGQLRLLGEDKYDGGTVGCIDHVLKPRLLNQFAQCPVKIICDPANPKDEHRSVTATALLKEQGFDAIVAPGNNKLQGRVNAVSVLLKRTGGFVVTPGCPMIHAGLNGEYVYKLDAAATKALGTPIYRDEKENNEWGHYVDSAQNICLWIAKGGGRYQQSTAPPPGVNRINVRRVV